MLPNWGPYAHSLLRRDAVINIAARSDDLERRVGIDVGDVQARAEAGLMDTRL